MTIKSVLFVCMGNICRSPTAEAMFRALVQQAQLDIKVESAGTIAYHQGRSPDKRSIAAGVKRGLCFDGMTARQVRGDDFSAFDLILAADKQNLDDLRGICPSPLQSKLGLILDTCKFAEGEVVYDEVPDPYYGTGDGFELVLDLLENSCSHLVASIRDNKI
ncbi:low molecular weight phosphotyrosine protein phosphatase [Shewanella sp. KX20019]|uniref:low molecular weight protein-tyrosine-phosphatase n=1 Tax=Shewanella sp. KX20019 TaxID=2803864 RepID=UPI0019265896|nr:low molecular weight protein-tyrosine-phosphatase [Shewanella sp. KX20019]QQX78574.1 low molecular weight phosphotyrosine protein phosphatase [Shewanella sp. KX20019]